MHETTLTIRLTPRGGRDRVEGWASAADGSVHLKARVSAAPEDGKANAALVKLLGDTLGVARSAIRIVSGQTSRLKRVAIVGDAVQLEKKLKALGKAK